MPRVLFAVQEHRFPVGSPVKLKPKCPNELRKYVGLNGRVLSNQGDYTTVSFDGRSGISVNTGYLEVA